MRVKIIFLSVMSLTVFWNKIFNCIELKTIEKRNAQNPLVDFDAYMDVAEEVRVYRKNRLLNIEEFNEMSKDSNTIILDTRAEKMFEQLHIKNAVHLNFSDFNENTLAAKIPSKETRILIYCNNNFEDDSENFPNKIFRPKSGKEIPLALNIPTFINLYAYGYKNVYELKDLLSIYDKRIKFNRVLLPYLQKI